MSERNSGRGFGLTGHQTIGLDSNVLIYLVETRGPLADVVTSIVDMIADGQVVGVLSAIGLVEILVGPARVGDGRLFETIAGALRDLPIRIVPLSGAIAQDAAWIRVDSRGIMCRAGGRCAPRKRARYRGDGVRDERPKDSGDPKPGRHLSGRYRRLSVPRPATG